MQLLLTASLAVAASAQILSLPLIRRADGIDAGLSIQQELAALETKYAPAVNTLKRKRATNVAITGVTELANYNIDLMYQVELSLGSAGQKVKVQLDSGSSDLWVAQKGCVQCNVQDAVLFDSSKSSTYSNSGEGFQTTYSSAAVRCTKATDTVGIAELNVDASFGVCDAQVGMAYPASLGILGLGFQGNAKSGSKPWVQQAYEQGAISSPSFALSLASSQGGASGGNQLTLGGYDEKAISGDILWLPGQSTKFWSVALDAVSFNGQSVFSAAGEQMQTIIDTGSSLITGPPAAVKMLYSNVPGAQETSGGWQFPCANTPQVSLQLGGQSFAIPAADLIRGYTDASKTTCLGAINSAVIANDVSKSVGWLLGDAFLKSVYTIFDMGENKVGFAQKSGSVSQSGGFTRVPMTLVTTNTAPGNFAPAAATPQQVTQQTFKLSSSVPSIKSTVPHAAGVPIVAAKKGQAQINVQPEQQIAAQPETQASAAPVVAAAPVSTSSIATLGTPVAVVLAQTSLPATTPVVQAQSSIAISSSVATTSSSTTAPTSRMVTSTQVASSASSSVGSPVAATTRAASVPVSGAGSKTLFSVSSMLVMALGGLFFI